MFHVLAICAGACAGALARFQVEGDPGSVMTFKPPNPIRIDMSQFIGQDIERLTLGLVDKDGEATEDTWLNVRGTLTSRDILRLKKSGVLPAPDPERRIPQYQKACRTL